MTPYRKTVLIYNPQAGKIGRSGGKLVRRATEILEKRGHRVTAAPTTGPRTAGGIAREHIAQGADLIVVAGGDGVINETVEGMAGCHTPLAVLPGGTANVLAMETELGSFEHAAKHLDELVPRRISLGYITFDRGRESRYFLLMAGIGLDAHIVYHVSGPLKARIGKFAYWAAGYHVVGGRLPQIHVEFEGEARECSFALLSKVRNYGGDFKIAREVNLLEDRFELVLFEGRTSFRFAKYLAGLILGRVSGLKGVTTARVSCAKLCCPEDRRVYVQIDGEYAGHLPAEVRIVPDALTLLMPRDYGA